MNSITLRFLWEVMNDFIQVDHPVRQQERYFLLEGAGQDLLTGVQAIHQQEGILEARWWTRAELEATTEPVFPEELATLLGRISALVSPVEEGVTGDGFWLQTPNHEER